MLLVQIKESQTSLQPFEIIERKGKGHPDTICDAIAEAISVRLANEYLKYFDTILHYNIDKALLAAGVTEKFFGGGKVIKPMKLYIGDRATSVIGKKTINVNEIAIEEAQNWFKKNLPALDTKKQIQFYSLLASGSEELSNIFVSHKKVYLANDTSAAVGVYPLTTTEKLVLELEHYLNSTEFKSLHPETGIDVKVMALRKHRELSITIAMPLLSKLVSSENDYFDKKDVIKTNIKRFLQRYEYFDKIHIELNALDKIGKGIEGVYLSLAGTSAEDADSGEVGRGNRVNGIISVTRPLGTEAAAGKNPISHVGKIYNVFAHKLAKTIYENVAGINEVYIFLVSEIGKPIDNPKVIAVKVSLTKDISIKAIKKEINMIVEDEFSRINNFCDDLSLGKYSAF